MTLPLDKLPQFAGVTTDLLHPLNVLSVSWAVLYRTLRTFSPDTLIIRRNRHNHHHHHRHNEHYHNEEYAYHHDNKNDYEPSEFDEINTNQDEYASNNYNASEDDVERRHVERFRPRSYSKSDDVENSRNLQSEHESITSLMESNKYGNTNSKNLTENYGKKELQTESMKNLETPEQVSSQSSEHQSRRKNKPLRINNEQTQHVRSAFELLEHSYEGNDNKFSTDRTSFATEPHTPTSATSLSHSTIVMRSTEKTSGRHLTRRSHSAEEALTNSRRLSLRERRRHKSLEPLPVRSHSASSTGLSTSSAQENSTSFTAIVSESESENRISTNQPNTESNADNISEHVHYRQLGLRSKDHNVLTSSKNVTNETDSKIEEIIEPRRENRSHQEKQQEQQWLKHKEKLVNPEHNDKETMKDMEKENILLTPVEKLEQNSNNNKRSTVKAVPLGKPPLSGRSRVSKLNLSNSDEFNNVKSSENKVLSAPPPLSALHSEPGLTASTSTLSNSAHHTTTTTAHKKIESASHLSRSSMRSPRHRSSRSKDNFVNDENLIHQGNSVLPDESQLSGISSGNNSKRMRSSRGVDGRRSTQSEISEHKYNRKHNEEQHQEEEEELKSEVEPKRHKVHNTEKSIYYRFMQRDMRQEAKLITHILRAVPVSLLHFICSVQRQMAALPLLAFDDVSSRLKESANISDLNSDDNFSLNNPSSLSKESLLDERALLTGVASTGQLHTQETNDNTRMNNNDDNINDDANLDAISERISVFASLWTKESFLSSASSSSSSSMVVHFLLLRIILQLLCNYAEKALFLDDSLAVRQLRSRSFGRRCAGWILRLTSHTLLDPILLSVITPMLCLVNEAPEHGVNRQHANVKRQVGGKPDDTFTFTSAHSKSNIAGRQSNTSPDVPVRFHRVEQSDLERNARAKNITLLKEDAPSFMYKSRISVPGVLHALVNGATSVLLQYLITPFATMLCDRACVTVCEGFEYWFMRRYTVWPSEDEEDEESEDEEDDNYEDGNENDESKKHYSQEQKDETRKDIEISELHHDENKNILSEEHVDKLTLEERSQSKHNSLHLIKDHVQPTEIVEQAEAQRNYKMSAREKREQRRQAKKLREMRRAERQAAADASAHACILRAIFYRVGSSLFAQCVIEHPLSVLVEVAKGRAVMHLAGMLASYDTLPENAFGVQWHSIVSYAHSLIKRAETTLSSDEISERRVLPYVMALLSICGMTLSNEMYMLLSCIKKMSGQEKRVAELRSANRQGSSQSALAASIELIMRTVLSYTPLYNAVEYTVIDKGVSFYMAVYTRLRRQVSSSA